MMDPHCNRPFFASASLYTLILFPPVSSDLPVMVLQPYGLLQDGDKYTLL